jgi:hypothetical protein
MSKRIPFIAGVLLAAGAILGYSTSFSPSVAIQNEQMSAPTAQSAGGMSPAVRIHQAFEALASVQN